MKRLIFTLVAALCVIACGKENGGNSVKQLYLDEYQLDLIIGASATLTTILEPADASVTVKWTSNDPDIATVVSGVVTAHKAGKTTITAAAGKASAMCFVTVSAVPEGAVDLGLGVLWASCNLGATKPEEYGRYYAWGETETKFRYLLQDYKWGDGSEVNGSEHMTKYTGTGDTQLELDDDAARTVLGAPWRTPTKQELEDLVNKCTWTKASRRDYLGYEVWGYEVTGANGNSIFIPSAGYYYDRRDGAVTYCYLQSSTRSADRADFSYRLYANGPNPNKFVEAFYREYGYPIRPVLGF